MKKGDDFVVGSILMFGILFVSLDYSSHDNVFTLSGNSVGQIGWKQTFQMDEASNNRSKQHGSFR